MTFENMLFDRHSAWTLAARSKAIRSRTSGTNVGELLYDHSWWGTAQRCVSQRCSTSLLLDTPLAFHIQAFTGTLWSSTKHSHIHCPHAVQVTLSGTFRDNSGGEDCRGGAFAINNVQDKGTVVLSGTFENNEASEGAVLSISMVCSAVEHANKIMRE